MPLEKETVEKFFLNFAQKEKEPNDQTAADTTATE